MNWTGRAEFRGAGTSPGRQGSGELRGPEGRGGRRGRESEGGWGGPSRLRGPLLLHVTTIPMSLTFLVGQIDFMKSRGFGVRAVSSPGRDLVRFARREGVAVSAVRMNRRITPWEDIKSLWGLVRVMRRTRPAIVHGHTPKGGLLAMIAALVAGSSVRIYHMRGLPMLTATGFRRRLLWCAERSACALAHRTLCVSRSVRDQAVAEGLCPPDRIKVLAGGSGNGVDAGHRFNPDRTSVQDRQRTRERLGIPADAPVIGYVGRVVREKGIVELADAWQRLRHFHPDARLVLVGPFEPEDPVPAATEAILRDDPRIHLVGMDWNTPPLYAAMDLVVLPTYREGFPNVPLEAAAMGLPVVATRVPGCIDAIRDEVTGLLVPPRDAAALALAIGRYLESDALRRDHGQAGRERVRSEFRQEVIWEALYQEYVRLMDERGAMAPTLLHGLGEAGGGGEAA
jgi:glycosyltransferase involved in cell wall biosynthesis